MREIRRFKKKLMEAEKEKQISQNSLKMNKKRKMKSQMKKENQKGERNRTEKKNKKNITKYQTNHASKEKHQSGTTRFAFMEFYVQISIFLATIQFRRELPPR